MAFGPMKDIEIGTGPLPGKVSPVSQPQSPTTQPVGFGFDQSVWNAMPIFRNPGGRPYIFNYPSPYYENRNSYIMALNVLRQMYGEGKYDILPYIA
jgi:hypothetical protein